MPPKYSEEKEHKDQQLCIAVHTINNNICDANLLDNLINKAQLSEHCLTQHGGSLGLY